MKKIVHDLSPLAAFVVTAAALSLITHYLIIFAQKIWEATQGFQLTRGL
ncbi:MAG: hypothetical protein KF734_11530 [Saprospiraceae bacterium]|nr:hypothetical protein [Saprospiraceae bacterium]MCW5924812.1 hypothetical protein [Saprospiraceae bacterium]